MKSLLLILLLIIPAVSIAQNPHGMDPAKMMQRFDDPAAMQKMAAKAQAMQTCIAKIDQAKIDALEAQATALSDKIKALCDAGKKDETLKQAMSMGKKMQSDPTVKALRGC
jgi:hypothetical protein